MSESEMVSRVGRVFCCGKGGCQRPDACDADLFSDSARVAIAAMRKPTEAMIVDGFEAMKGDWTMCREAAEDAERCWHSMIDAALKPAEAVPDTPAHAP